LSFGIGLAHINIEGKNTIFQLNIGKPLIPVFQLEVVKTSFSEINLTKISEEPIWAYVIY
jgi:hypothetical protein